MVITAEQISTVLDLQAKLVYLQNQLKDIQSQRRSETLNTEAIHETNMKTISDKYATLISNKQVEIDNIQTNLNNVK
jgi:cytochrome c553